MAKSLTMQLRMSVERVAYVVLTWLLGDVIFAVLPIATIAFINKLLGSSFDSFLLTKEWSFASIVFFGVAIRKFIRLKVEIQHVPRSYKLDLGVQFFVALVIASVVVLSFVILRERGVAAQGQALFLGQAQLLLFISGLMAILAAIVVEERLSIGGSGFPNQVSRSWALRRIISRVEEATDCIDDVVYVTERAPTTTFVDFGDEIAARQEVERLYFVLEAAVDHLEKVVSKSKQQLDSLKLSQTAAAGGTQ